MTKSTLRSQCRAAREAMPAQVVASASERICSNLADWPVFQQAQTVMAYLAFGNEVNLRSLMGRCPQKRWIVPRTLHKPEPRLVLHPFDPARLVRHKFGMLEPDASLPAIDPRELDMVLVPGLAFDRRGYRLGFGGGFYDRFLAHVEAIKVGVAYEALIVERIPNDEFDQRVEWLACESCILLSVES